MEKMTIISRRRRRLRWIGFIALAAILLPNVRLTAKQKKRTQTAHRTSVQRRRRQSRHYRHYLHVRIQPARVREIQEALEKAGFFHDKPDGIWGPTTRDAMKQFQKQHGFSPTGLPEAKPLMLLGLGPHPLPPGLLPSPQVEAGAEAGSEDGTETSSASASPPAKKPTSSN
jgi:peptidoglycan hydrolase-like protein with peptidoglycan-binding domain